MVDVVDAACFGLARIVLHATKQVLRMADFRLVSRAELPLAPRSACLDLPFDGCVVAASLRFVWCFNRPLFSVVVTCS